MSETVYGNVPERVLDEAGDTEPVLDNTPVDAPASGQGTALPPWLQTVEDVAASPIAGDVVEKATSAMSFTARKRLYEIVIAIGAALGVAVQFIAADPDTRAAAVVGALAAVVSSLTARIHVTE